MSKYQLNITHKDSEYGQVTYCSNAQEALERKRKARDKGCKVEIRRIK